MTSVRRVLVVGGGVGGLASAIALRQQGVSVDLIEKNPAWDVYGVGITQPTNALRALNRIGLARAAVAQGHPISGGRAYLTDGRTMVGETTFAPTGDDDLPSGNGITRPRFHKIMQDHTLRSGVDVRVGVTFKSLDDDGDTVRITTTDGESRAYDLVIGADGIYSQVRQTVFPDAPIPRFTGQLCWRYNLPRIEGLDGIWTFAGPGGTTGLVPLATDLMYIFTTSTVGGPLAPRIEKLGIAAAYRTALAAWGGMIAEQRDLIVEDDEVVLRPLEAVLVPAPWYRGRVVLIGDAAHATTPHGAQGAAQALEDAITLADELKASDDVGNALHGFMVRRFETCKVVFESSLAVGRWEQDPTLPIDPNEERMKVMQAARVLP